MSHASGSGCPAQQLFPLDIIFFDLIHFCPVQSVKIARGFSFLQHPLVSHQQLIGGLDVLRRIDVRYQDA